MAEQALDSPTSTSPTAAWSTARRALRSVSLSRVQAVIGTLAGIVSIGGAAISVLQFTHPPNTGDLVAIVEAAGSHRSLADATVEVLNSQNAIVATMTPDPTGRVSQSLREGVYIVRVSHPRYAADVRRVQVTPQHTVEVRASLRAGTSAPASRAMNEGVRALRRAFGF